MPPLGAFSGIVTLTAFAFKSARFVPGELRIFNHLEWAKLVGAELRLLRSERGRCCAGGGFVNVSSRREPIVPERIDVGANSRAKGGGVTL